MLKTVVIVGALDTKGAEFAFVRDLVERQGLKTLVVDFGVMGEPAFVPDVGAKQVAQAGGDDLARLRSGGHKDHAMRTMAAGLAAIVLDVYREGKLDGILGMGGTGGTSIATAAMRALPLGVPKVMVSTVGGGDVSAYAGYKDIVFIPSIVDIAGLNRISRAILANAAGAIAGMVKLEAPPVDTARPLIAATMLGITTACVDRARGALEAAGYEVLVFHATGVGGRTMESLIADGHIAGLLDLTTTELADEVGGGIYSAGPDRLMAAARAGLPAVLAPGGVDKCCFGGPDTVPDKYRRRTLYAWNPNTTLLRTNPEENAVVGELIARAANASRGPVAILLPLKGVSMLDSPGQPFWDPGADQACYQAIKNTVHPNIPVIELDAHINDPGFADTAASLLLRMLQSS
ncbi:MAG: Tm-1-like ATP-binding domain-containing protein [Thermoflexales bacterium]|nr:Tm-1-like ATP-binding domain-containing protein [Thermoflexales bacterium]